MDGWKTSFLLGWLHGRCCVSFRERIRKWKNEINYRASHLAGPYSFFHVKFLGVPHVNTDLVRQHWGSPFGKVSRGLSRSVFEMLHFGINRTNQKHYCRIQWLVGEGQSHVALILKTLPDTIVTQLRKHVQIHFTPSIPFPTTTNGDQQGTWAY